MVALPPLRQLRQRAQPLRPSTEEGDMTPFRWLVAAGCVYELAALHERSPLPTISKLLNTAASHPVLRVLTWAWCGAWAWHFLVVPTVEST
jgi:hypothetical protein